MKTLTIAIACLLIATVATSANAERGATTLCVGSQPGCYTTIQAAIDAAPGGATIRILAGTYSGGITIRKNVKLKGAGSAETTISGGGPVLTIGIVGAPTEPTVAISGVTITGGLNTATMALGGGIAIPASSVGLGATTTITDSVVTGNHAAPASVMPGCGSHPFALASGGGIDNAGTMTLDNVAVTNNEAGSDVTSDADGGGIMNERGAVLTLRTGVVSGNVARVTTPNGRFAAGGGIFTRRGSALTVLDSRVDGNSVDYTTSVASDDPCSGIAQAAGIKIGGDETTSVTLRGSSVSRNVVTAVGSGADAVAFAGGIDNDGALTLADSTLDGNRVTAAGTTASVDAGALEIEGPATLRNVRLTENDVSANASSGPALAQGGAMVAASDQAITASDTIITGNAAHANSPNETSVEGGGILNAGSLDLRQVTVRDNSGSADGSSGAAQGGGIWNAPLPDGPPVQLTVRDSSVTRNTLTATSGLARQGGGIYTTLPLVLTNSLVAKNVPDDCFGC
jgi:hypothetical protein